MPAVVSSSVGSPWGTSEELGITVCPFPSKKSRKAFLSSSPVTSFSRGQRSKYIEKAWLEQGLADGALLHQASWSVLNRLGQVMASDDVGALEVRNGAAH